MIVLYEEKSSSAHHLIWTEVFNWLSALWADQFSWILTYEQNCSSVRSPWWRKQLSCTLSTMDRIVHLHKVDYGGYGSTVFCALWIQEFSCTENAWTVIPPTWISLEQLCTEKRKKSVFEILIKCKDFLCAPVFVNMCMWTCVCLYMCLCVPGCLAGLVLPWQSGEP